MYKTIGVLLDGSKRAETILSHIEKLSTLSDASVIFIQVVEPSPLIVGPEGDIALHQHEIERWENQAHTYLSAIEGEFKKKGLRQRSM